MTIVKFNIGGRIFETYKDTILKYPETLLGRTLINNTNENWGKTEDNNKIYFFDRNPDLFSFILDYYRTNQIIYPKIISKEDFQKELDYWCIDYEKNEKNTSKINLEYLIFEICKSSNDEYLKDLYNIHKELKINTNINYFPYSEYIDHLIIAIQEIFNIKDVIHGKAYLENKLFHNRYYEIIKINDIEYYKSDYEEYIKKDKYGKYFVNYLSIRK